MTYLKLILSAFFSGGTFIAGRMLAGHVQPFSAAFLRYAVASAVLLTVLRFRHGCFPRLPSRLLWPILVLGLSGVFFYNVFFFWGLVFVPAGRAAVVVANNPVIIAVGAALCFGHNLDRIRSTGIFISVCGAVTAVSGGEPAALFHGGLGWGDLLIAGCVLSWAAFSLMGKPVLAQIPALTAVSYAAAAGTVMLAIPALLEGTANHLVEYTLADWAALGYLGIFGTALGFVWYYEGIDKLGPTRAALFINFVPLFAIGMAYVILSEPVGWSLALGTTLVVCGVYLTNNGPVWPWRLNNASRK